MSESNEMKDKFFGAYVDRDAVLRLARWSDTGSWIVLAIYLVTSFFSIALFLSQYYNGMMGQKGLNMLMGVNLFSPYLTQALPGVFYFFGLQGISKGLLIFLDMEDSTRRMARK